MSELEEHLADLDWYLRKGLDSKGKHSAATARGSGYTYHLFPPKQVMFQPGDEVNVESVLRGV